MELGVLGLFRHILLPNFREINLTKNFVKMISRKYVLADFEYPKLCSVLPLFVFNTLPVFFLEVISYFIQAQNASLSFDPLLRSNNPALIFLHSVLKFRKKCKYKKKIMHELFIALCVSIFNPCTVLYLLPYFWSIK